MVRCYFSTKPTNLSSCGRQEIDSVILGQIIPRCCVLFVSFVSLTAKLLVASSVVLRVQTASETPSVSSSAARFPQHTVLNDNEVDSFKAFRSARLGRDMGNAGQKREN